jgi:hypothetical protein
LPNEVANTPGHIVIADLKVTIRSTDVPAKGASNVHTHRGFLCDEDSHACGLKVNWLV